MLISGEFLIFIKTFITVTRLHLAKIGVELEVLDQTQADYIGVTVNGPFKADYYIY